MFNRIREDIAAIKERDPAATTTASVLFNYPGLHAIWAHRVNNWLWSRGRKGLARFGSQCARFYTGIEIHPGATIGRGFFIDHGMGVVIGETSIIGEDVTIYQGVTLGGTGKETGKRHPTLEDCVVIGVGASVLGNITVGHGSKVGGGAVVIDDVPPNSTVVGVPGRVVMRSGQRVEAIDLHHEDLPDPVVEMFLCLTRRLDRLERREPVHLTAPGEQRPGEQPKDRQPKDQQPPSEASEASGEAGSVAENPGDEGPISVEFGGNTWQI